jgi:hypothetical protein
MKDDRLPPKTALIIIMLISSIMWIGIVLLLRALIQALYWVF